MTKIAGYFTRLFCRSRNRLYILNTILKLEQFFFDIFSILAGALFSKFKRLRYESFPWNSLIGQNKYFSEFSL